MQIPTVERFLFCISLETGAKILGAFVGIGAIVALLISFVLFGFAAVNYQALLNATLSEHKEILQLLEKAQYGMLQHRYESLAYRRITDERFRYSCRAATFLASRV